MKGAWVGVLAVAFLVLGAVFGVYYFQTTESIGSLNQTVKMQSSQISLQAQAVAADVAKIEMLNATAASLNSQVAADELRITSITVKDAQANATVFSLNSQITSLTSQISSDETQIASLESTLDSLNGVFDQTAVLMDANNYFFSVANGGEWRYNVSSAVPGYYVVDVITSTSQNTIVSSAPASLPSGTLDVGSSGIAMFRYDTAIRILTLGIYDQNGQSFSAVVSIWFFYS